VMSTTMAKPLTCVALNAHGRLSAPSLLALQRRCSSAFDPYWYLHYQTVNRNQQGSFEKMWFNNQEELKTQLSTKEFGSLQQKLDKVHTFKTLEAKMTGLFGLSRHAWVRKTRTWSYSNERVLQYIKDGNNPSTLIFGDNEVFDKFRKKYLSDPEKLLTAFKYADLRYMCAVQCIDYCGGPPMLAVFGVRENYHYNIPDPKDSGAVAHLQYNNKLASYHWVVLAALNATKDNQPIDANYFKNLLDSKQHNVFQDAPWSHFAKQTITMDEGEFYDQLIRAFVQFQTDPGVCDLKTRFDTDLIDGPHYDELRVWGLKKNR